MFEAIQYVGTPIALVAFIVAVVAYVYRGRLEERRKLIESAPEQDRARVMEATLRDFSTVPTDTLTKEQRYNLALQLIEERRAKFRLLTMVSVIVALLLASVVVVLALVPGQDVGPLTVRALTPNAMSDQPVTGTVTVDAGESGQTQSIDARGEARFENIPDRAYRNGVRIIARVEGFAPRADTLRARPLAGVHEVSLVPEPTRVYGTVLDEARRPLPDIVVNFHSGAAIDTTDAQGNFSVLLPFAPGAQIPVRATRSGVTGLNDQVTIPRASPLTLYFTVRS